MTNESSHPASNAAASRFRSIAFGKRIKIPRRVYRAGAPGGSWWPGASLAPAPQSPGTPSSPRTRARGEFILASLMQFVIQRPLTAPCPQVFAALAPGEAPGSGTSGAGASSPPSSSKPACPLPKKTPAPAPGLGAPSPPLPGSSSHQPLHPTSGGEPNGPCHAELKVGE